jgi:hypothetical protein
VIDECTTDSPQNRHAHHGIDLLAASWSRPLYTRWWHQGNVIHPRIASKAVADPGSRFLTDYIHTFAILILSCWLTAKVITSESVGSIGRLYDLVVDAQSNHVVEGNYEGSLLTMTSQQGIYFAIILLTSNFGAVVVCQPLPVTSRNLT